MYYLQIVYTHTLLKERGSKGCIFPIWWQNSLYNVYCVLDMGLSVGKILHAFFLKAHKPFRKSKNCVSSTMAVSIIWGIWGFLISWLKFNHTLNKQKNGK